MTGVRDEFHDLVTTVGNGDAAAVNSLLERVRPTVMRTCARFLDVPEDVEDATQEALLQLGEALPTHPEQSSHASM